MYKKKAFVRKPLRKYKAKPKPAIQRSLKYIQNYVHPVVQCTNLSFRLNTLNGFTSPSGILFSLGLQFQFTQNTVNYKYGSSGLSGTATVFANSASLSNVYDCYRLKKVVCSWLFSNNASQLTNSLHTLPIIYAVTDKDDSNSLASSQIAMAYSDCKIVQLGNQRGDGMQYITLKDPATETDVTTTSGGFVSAVRGMNQWLDSDDTSAAYNGIKVFCEFPGSTGTTDVGTITFFFRCYYEYKENH